MAYSSGYSTSTDRYGADTGYQNAAAPAAYQPGGQYYGATQGEAYGLHGETAMADTSPGILNDIYSQWYNNQYLPNQASMKAQTDLLQNQIDLTGLQSGLSSRVAGQNAMFSMADIGLSREQLGIQQGTLARQMGLLPQEYALQGRQFDVQGRRLDEQTKESWLGAAEQQRAAKGAGIAQGNLMLPGAPQQRADIAQHLQNALTNIGFSRDDLQIAREKAALDYQEKQAQQKDAEKQLGVQAKRLGLSEDEVRARLQNSLDQIGISSAVSVDQLLGEIQKVEQGGTSVFSPLFAALQQAGVITLP
jgi:hypothetical protein